MYVMFAIICDKEYKDIFFYELILVLRLYLMAYYGSKLYCADFFHDNKYL